MRVAVLTVSTRGAAGERADTSGDAIVAWAAGHGWQVAARDSLRLEVFYPLYGNDLDDETTPLEATLGWIVRLRKDDFVGKQALIEQKARGLTRKLVGFKLSERGFPRHGMPVVVGGAEFGAVRSGTVSPSTGDAIGTAYLPAAACEPGTAFQVDIRGRRVGAEVVTTPFYTQGSRRA